MKNSSINLRFENIREGVSCNPDDKLKDVLHKFDNSKGRPIVVLSEKGNLVGLLSSGDVRRYISRENHKFEECLVYDVCNKNPIYVKDTDSNTVIERILSENITLAPLLDCHRTVIGIVYNGYPSITIGKRRISIKDRYIYLIAEVGVNHNGSLEEALFLIKQSIDAGFDAIKLQIRSEETYSKDEFLSKDLSVQYIESEIKRTFLSWEKYKLLIKYIKDHKADVICTPFDEKALNFVVESNVDAIKIASCDLTNDPLLIKASKSSKPIILSTGMSTESEILHSHELLNRHGDHAFLHCNSTYPAPPEDINLSYIARLRDITNSVCGYSSHDGNVFIPYASIGFGARIIECHVTRKKDQKGTDHLASLEVSGLIGFVKSIRMISESIGDDLPREPSQGELMNKISLGKSLCFKKKLTEGHIISQKDLILKSPAIGFSYSQLKDVIGKSLTSSVNSGQTLLSNHIDNSLKENEHYKNILESNLVPGIPVRYHDIEYLNSIFNLPLYEFHMSSHDLTLNPKKFLGNKSYQDKELIVHSVEQYNDGFIIDLASDDNDHYNISYRKLVDLLIHIEQLRYYFSNSNEVPVILNCGGHTKDKPLNLNESINKTKKIAKAISSLQSEFPFTKILAQTMPPFPWHQGGRAFHNCLSHKDSIKEYIDIAQLGICMDISHSALAANHFGFDFIELIQDLSNNTEHLHIADASKSNQEGQQIGDGDLDFKEILKIYTSKSKKYTFIPEIWKGHLNNGEGFNNGLIYLDECIRSIQ